MVLGDVSLTAQDTEIFWLAKGWAKPGSAAGHQPDFWLRADRPRKLQSVSSPSAEPGPNSPDEDQLWGPASWWRDASTQSWTDSPARCHKGPSGQKSLGAHLPNQAPIKDPPSSTLLTSLSSLLLNINNETTNQVGPVCYFDQAKKGKTSHPLIFHSSNVFLWRRQFSLINRHDVTKIIKKSSPSGFLVHTLDHGLWKMIDFYRKCIKTPVLTPLPLNFRGMSLRCQTQIVSPL